LSRVHCFETSALTHAAALPSLRTGGGGRREEEEENAAPVADVVYTSSLELREEEAQMVVCLPRPLPEGRGVQRCWVGPAVKKVVAESGRREGRERRGGRKEGRMKERQDAREAAFT